MPSRRTLWIVRIAGDPDRTPLPHRTLNLLLFLAVFQAGYFLVADTLVGQHLAFPLIDLAMLMVFGWLYGQVRFRDRFFPANHLFAVAGLALCQLNFFLNAGFSGPGLLVTLSLLMVLNILHPGRTGLWYSVAGAILVFSGIAIQVLHPEWILGYRKPESQGLDYALTFLLCLGALATVARMVMRFHDEMLEHNARIQSAAAQSEQMAILGEMIAGLGHEIGTPVGVMASCLDLNQDWWKTELPKFRPLWAQMTEAQRSAFFSLLEDGLRAPMNFDADSRTSRLKREEVIRKLSDRGLPGARALADDLVALELSDWDPEWNPLLETAAGRDGWAFVVQTLLLNRSNQLSLRALDRINGLVGALGAYSRTGSPEDRPEPTQLSVGLDSVLTLYAAARKHTVEIVRDYAELPPVLARAEALVQVWTNLIQNALQAMNFAGTLTVLLRQEGEWAVVAVEDTGPGVPPGLRDKIFQLFYTTKERGAGTGIGLAIAHKIVVAHGGTITVGEATGGGARFEVRLPLAGAPA